MLTLHRVTWLMIFATVIAVVGDLMRAAALYRATAQLRVLDPGSAATVGEQLGLLANSLGFSLSLFGVAATVEFLFRIWRELKLRRTGTLSDQPDRME